MKRGVYEKDALTRERYQSYKQLFKVFLVYWVIKIYDKTSFMALHYD